MTGNITKSNNVYVVKQPDGGNEVIPFVWPDTTTAALTDTFKRNTFEMGNELDGIPPSKRTAYVLSQLAKYKRVPQYMLLQSMPADAVNK